MERQCAWCLCLIDNVGERISSTPLPKLYEASHGICSVCGTQWMQQATAQEPTQASISKRDASEHTTQRLYLSQLTPSSDIPDLLLQLQQEARRASEISHVVRKKSLDTIL